MSARYFTPAQVNQLIPELEKIIRHLSILESEIHEKELRLRAKAEADRGATLADQEAIVQQEAEIEFLRIVARSQFDRVQQLGGEIKQGFLVDFPGLIAGQEVLLCWKPGEQTVQWCHGLHEGFMGRRKIPTEYLDHGCDDEESEDGNLEIH